MDNKIGILMELPDGKKPGYYAQIIKALANQALLFDRDKEMLIVSNEQARSAVLEIMSQYKVTVETMVLWLLPDHTELTSLWDDYGFVSIADNHYLYTKLVSSFQFKPDTPASERHQAVLQMDEHLLAFIPGNMKDVPRYIHDKQLEELMIGIATAYGCQIEYI
ncbi:hypothetical protein D3C73_620190 [compost metagenome]